MTKKTGQKNSPQKKHQNKFSYLYPNSTKSNRKDFIEFEYVRGVYDENGNQVIRPLNAEELDFLNKFYKESVHNSFNKTDKTSEIVKEIRSLKRKYSNWRRKKGNAGQVNAEIEAQIEAKKREFREANEGLDNFYPEYDQQYEIRSDNYKRKECVINMKKNNGELLEYKEYEDYEVESSWEEMLEDLIKNSEEVK